MKLNAKKTNLLSWRQPVLWAVIIVGDVSGRLVANTQSDPTYDWGLITE